jgi:hypothetical protein
VKVTPETILAAHDFTVEGANRPGEQRMWTSGHNVDIRLVAHRYEPTREAAMAA